MIGAAASTYVIDRRGVEHTMHPCQQQNAKANQKVHRQAIMAKA
ncbi:MAG: hypothetical protein AB3N13_11930 [Arenibacterium sp.]